MMLGLNIVFILGMVPYFDQIMRSDSTAVGSAPLTLEYCVLRPPPIRVPAPRIYPHLPPNVSNQHTTYICQPAQDSIHGVCEAALFYTGVFLHRFELSEVTYPQ